MVKTWKTWNTVRSEAVSSGRLDEAKLRVVRAETLATLRAYKLAELRESVGLNQTQLAELLGISQSRVSRIERGDLEHTEVATLRTYAQALGGDLEIVVRRGDERLTLS